MQFQIVECEKIVFLFYSFACFTNNTFMHVLRAISFMRVYPWMGLMLAMGVISTENDERAEAVNEPSE